MIHAIDYAPRGYTFLVQYPKVSGAEEAIAWAKRVFRKDDVRAVEGHVTFKGIYSQIGWMLFWREMICE